MEADLTQGLPPGKPVLHVRFPFPLVTFSLGLLAFVLPWWGQEITHEYVLVFFFSASALFFSEAGNGLAQDYYAYRAGQRDSGLSRQVQPEQLVLKGAWGSYLLAFLFVLLISMRLGFDGWKTVLLSTLGFFTGYYAHADPFFWDRSFLGRCWSLISVTWVPFLISSVALSIEINSLKFMMISVFYGIALVMKTSRSPQAVERYSKRRFPPYTYLPGQSAHPHRDPGGHAYGQVEVSPGKTRPEDWRETEAYLYGIDLFNAGYYWEAHEVWEGLWKELSPTEDHARFLQALIQLAAASLKYRTNHGEGVVRLFAQAMEKLQDLEKRYPQGYMGLKFRSLIQSAMKTFALAQYVKSGESLPKFRPLTLVLG